MTTNRSSTLAGTKVTSSDGKTHGHLTGGRRRCGRKGCRELRYATRWEDGRTTYPCRVDMTWQGGAWKLKSP